MDNDSKTIFILILVAMLVGLFVIIKINIIIIKNNELTLIAEQEKARQSRIDYINNRLKKLEFIRHAIFTETGVDPVEKSFKNNMIPIPKKEINYKMNDTNYMPAHIVSDIV